jgi:hypothetical protein
MPDGSCFTLEAAVASDWSFVGVYLFVATTFLRHMLMLQVAGRRRLACSTSAVKLRKQAS